MRVPLPDAKWGNKKVSTPRGPAALCCDASTGRGPSVTPCMCCGSGYLCAVRPGRPARSSVPCSKRSGAGAKAQTVRSSVHRADRRSIRYVDRDAGLYRRAGGIRTGRSRHTAFRVSYATHRPTCDGVDSNTVRLELGHGSFAMMEQSVLARTAARDGWDRRSHSASKSSGRSTMKRWQSCVPAGNRRPGTPHNAGNTCSHSWRR